MKWEEKKRLCRKPGFIKLHGHVYHLGGIAKMWVLIRRAGAVQSLNSEAAPMRCWDHWSRTPGRVRSQALGRRTLHLAKILNNKRSMCVQIRLGLSHLKYRGQQHFENC